MFSVYFLIKSTSAYSSESFDVSVSVRAGDGMGGSSGKITFDERGVSFGKVFSLFSAIKYEFLPLCDLFLSLLALTFRPPKEVQRTLFNCIVVLAIFEPLPLAFGPWK